MVKLVDTKDLKSLPFWECQFESGRGHHKKMKNLIIISDKNPKSQIIKKDINNILKDKIIKKKKFDHSSWWRWVYASNFKKI